MSAALARTDARVATALYAAFLLAAPTLYAPLFLGRDESWLVVASVAFAHVGLGAGVRNEAVLIPPALLCVVVFFLDGADGLAWFILIFGLPLAVLLAAAGWGIGSLLAGRARYAVIAAFALAALPVPLAARQWADRIGAPHVSADVRRQLMTDWSFGNLCRDAETPPHVARRLRRAVRVLIRELERKPRQLVRYTYVYSDDPSETKTITLREYAEEQLSDLDDRCGADDVRRRIEAAL